MIQIAAGLAITEDRHFIKDEDIEWIIHASQLTPRMDKKIDSNPSVGFINGLSCVWAQ